MAKLNQYDLFNEIVGIRNSSCEHVKRKLKQGHWPHKVAQDEYLNLLRDLDSFIERNRSRL